MHEMIARHSIEEDRDSVEHIWSYINHRLDVYLQDLIEIKLNKECIDDINDNSQIIVNICDLLHEKLMNMTSSAYLSIAESLFSRLRCKASIYPIVIPVVLGICFRFLIRNSCNSMANSQNSALIDFKVSRLTMMLHNIKSLISLNPIMDESMLFQSVDDITNQFIHSYTSYEMLFIIMSAYQVFIQSFPGGRRTKFVANVLMKILMVSVKLQQMVYNPNRYASNKPFHHRNSNTVFVSTVPTSKISNKVRIMQINDISLNISKKLEYDNCQSIKKSKTEVFDAIESSLIVKVDDVMNQDSNKFDQLSECFSARDRDKSYISLIVDRYRAILSSSCIEFNSLNDIWLQMRIFFDNLDSVYKFYDPKTNSCQISYSNRLFESIVFTSFSWLNGYLSYITNDSGQIRNFASISWISENFELFSNTKQPHKNRENKYLGGSKWLSTRYLILLSLQGISKRVYELIYFILTKIVLLIQNIMSSDNIKDSDLDDHNVLMLLFLTQLLLTITCHIKVYISFEVLLKALLTLSEMIVSFMDKMSVAGIDRTNHAASNKSNISEELERAYHILMACISYFLVHQDNVFLLLFRDHANNQNPAYDNISDRNGHEKELNTIDQCVTCRKYLNIIFDSQNHFENFPHPLVSFVLLSQILQNIGIVISYTGYFDLIQRLLLKQLDRFDQKKVNISAPDFMQIDVFSYSHLISPSLHEYLSMYCCQSKSAVRTIDEKYLHISNIHVFTSKDIKQIIIKYQNNYLKFHNSQDNLDYDKRSKFTLKNLNDDLLQYLLFFLSHKRLCRLAMTSKYFHNFISNNQFLWKHIYHQRFTHVCYRNDHVNVHRGIMDQVSNKPSAKMKYVTCCYNHHVFSSNSKDYCLCSIHQISLAINWLYLFKVSG